MILAFSRPILISPEIKDMLMVSFEYSHLHRLVFLLMESLFLWSKLDQGHIYKQHSYFFGAVKNIYRKC